MAGSNRTKIEHDLRHIAEMLLLNGTLTECPGLVHGKMGIAVFFFHYARYTDTVLFSDYAMDLIVELQKQLHANSRADYERGIAGIGTGIDYLINNDFLETEEDIFEDFDQRMVRAVMHDPWQNFSLYDGLTGYGRYWISRMRYQMSSVQDRECLIRITERIEERLANIPSGELTDVYCFLRDLSELSGFDKSAGLLGRVYQRSTYINELLRDETAHDLKQILDLDKEAPPAGTGLLSGYAGEGMLRLTVLDPTIEPWMRLL